LFFFNKAPPYLEKIGGGLKKNGNQKKEIAKKKGNPANHKKKNEITEKKRGALKIKKKSQKKTRSQKNP